MVTFGKYRLIAELGHGGMADVFLAVLQGPEGFNKLCVVKRLRENLVEDPDLVAMLTDEARLAARLNHPNIVQTNEIGSHEGQYFITMEYLDGQPFNRVLRRAQLARPLLYRILADVLCGLHYAHQLEDYDGTPLGIVHRDVSPQNVFVTYTGQVKVVDFGIAKAARRTTETRTGMIKGKLAYMPPEQALAMEVDRRADIFAVGVMLYEVASRKRFWNKSVDDITILRLLAAGEYPVSPREVEPSVPDAIEAICRKALAPKPADRYATAAEMQKEIEAYLRSVGEHVASSDVGEAVSEAFADRRRQIKEIIEKELQAAEPRSGRIVDLSSVQGTTGGPHSSSSFVSQSLPPSQSGEMLATSATVLAATGAGAKSSTTLPSLDGRKRPRIVPRVVPWIAGGAAVVGVLAGGFVLARNGGSQVEAAVGSAAVPEPSLVNLKIRAVPAEAKIFVDGAALPSNPASTNLVRDGVAHTVRAEAPGYAAVTKLVPFDAPEVNVDLHLEAEATQGGQGGQVGQVGQDAKASATEQATPKRGAGTAPVVRRPAEPRPTVKPSAEAPPQDEPRATPSSTPTTAPAPAPSQPQFDKSNPWADG